MIVKSFKIGAIQKFFLESLLDDSLTGLYAPQCVQRIEEDGTTTTYLGDKVYFTTQSNKVISFIQYTLNDSFLINESNNLKIQAETAALIDFQPNFLSQGFYLDYINGKINVIEIFAKLSYQLDEDGCSEICIKDEDNQERHFIHIECEYVIRFCLASQTFNLMLSNERYFAGANDFIARFKILDNDRAEQLIQESFGWRSVLVTPPR